MKVICDPRGTVRVRGLAPLGVRVMVVPASGVVDGGVPLLFPQAQWSTAASATTAPRQQIVLMSRH
jgi:hypothetical protein